MCRTAGPTANSCGHPQASGASGPILPVEWTTAIVPNGSVRQLYLGGREPDDADVTLHEVVCSGPDIPASPDQAVGRNPTCGLQRRASTPSFSGCVPNGA